MPVAGPGEVVEYDLSGAAFVERSNMRLERCRDRGAGEDCGVLASLGCRICRGRDNRVFIRSHAREFTRCAAPV